jgi:quercetin dioxygenase-like cupin family protein
MSIPVAVSRLENKSHATPDEVRAPAKTRIEINRLEGFTIGRFTFEPGWRWSECIKPVAGTDSCQASHVGYLVSGVLGIRLDDGAERIIRAGESYTIPPGHDGWVVGNEPVICIEVMSAEQFGRPAS